MIGKRIYYERKFDKSYGKGKIIDKILKDGTNYYLVKTIKGVIQILPSSVKKIIK